MHTPPVDGADAVCAPPVQITPLYAAIGAGCVLCAYTCTRNLVTYPDIV